MLPGTIIRGVDHTNKAWRESATVRIDPSGKVYVSSGACPQGQGMETIFAQIVADT